MSIKEHEEHYETPLLPISPGININIISVVLLCLLMALLI